MGHVAIYVGERLPPNLVRLLSGVSKLAPEGLDLTVVGSGYDPSPLPDRYESYQVPGADATRGLSRLVATYRRLSRYLDATERPPDTL